MFVSAGASNGAIDAVTVMTTKGSVLATKRIVASPNGGPPRVEPYGNAKHFGIAEHGVSNIDDLALLLQRIEQSPKSFVIRGAPKDGIDRNYALRRVFDKKTKAGVVEPATFDPSARNWIPLDFDKIKSPDGLDPCNPDNAVGVAMSRLPWEFRDVSCFWQFTSSAGWNPNISLRLFFWSDRPLADWELKEWLADVPVDHSIFEPVQPIYVARPIFVGMTDPLPVRSGVWRGEHDVVSPPEITRPKRQRMLSFDGAVGGTTGSSGYEARCAAIGDHSGGKGFFLPVKSAVAAWFAENGSGGDAAWLRDDLERVIRAAVRDQTNHDDDYIEMRVDDLDGLIERIREMQAESEDAANYCDPTYPEPLGSLEEARDQLRDAMSRAVTEALDYQIIQEPFFAEFDFGPEPQYEPPAAVTLGVDVGVGKTHTFCTHGVPPLVVERRSVVLAVPRHRLGEEIVRDLAKAGIAARVYRGREALDPEAGCDMTMCRDLERVKLVEAAMVQAQKGACRLKDAVCPYFETCGYQRQRRETPDVWIVPHPLLFRARPSFIRHPELLAIDEAFWDGSLHGVDRPVRVWIRALVSDREIPGDSEGTERLRDISRRVHDLIINEPLGLLRRDVLSGFDLEQRDLVAAERLEWKRKVIPDVRPGMPIKLVREVCERAAEHNKEVRGLAKFWRCMLWTMGAWGQEKSPWIELVRTRAADAPEELAACLVWREGIHNSWTAPTVVMDATMPTEIVRQFFPGCKPPIQISAPMPHTYVRQITDRKMAGTMLIPTEGASESTNATRRNNVEKVRRFIEVRAADVRPGKVLVICQQKLELEINKSGRVPVNVEIEHFNNFTGENRWGDVALLIVVGRTEPPVREIEQIARAVFETAIKEIVPAEGGDVKWPEVQRGIRLRDGRGVAVMGNQHPDPRAEEVRRAICEGGLIQAIGRGRGVNRGAGDPLQIDILTNVVLPLEVDEVLTWSSIQPGAVDIMRAHGAVPGCYRDMAAAYPDLFGSPKAAEHAIRKNPPETPINNSPIGVWGGFLTARYRRLGSRGPASRLLYAPALIGDPAEWLQARVGAVTVMEAPACRASAHQFAHPPH